MTLVLDLPTEIFLEVVRFLELPDPISLLLTCSSLYSLSTQRSFWISALETTRMKSPIACPPHANLSRFTLETLKGLVFSWQKLQDNWNQPYPKIACVTSTHFQAPPEILASLQGTDILVLTTGDSVLCWDSKLATPCPFPAIEIGVIDSVSFTESPGIYSIALLTQKLGNTGTHSEHRYILTIKHEDGKVVSFTNRVSDVSISNSGDSNLLFLTEDVVGSIMTGDDEEQCIITVDEVNSNNPLLDSTSVLRLHRSVSTDRDLMECFTYKEHLYNLIEDGRSVQIQHISRRSLRAGHCEESSRFISEKAFSGNDFDPLFYPFRTLLPSTPRYGIGAIFVRIKEDEEDDLRSLTSFTFLPSSLTHSSDDDVSSPLAFDSPSVVALVPGWVLGHNHVWSDHSGSNIGAVVQTEADPPRLVLVRYHPDIMSTSVHALAVPDTIDLEELDGLCVDDATGAVHLVDNEGVLSTIRYV
ncbi:hypothetical protein DFH08DRAFT_116110 [Mycena albidolilacea]|uniref:F-box domain-containing protein n=1 Tax=Mycena albidolilacea TaxID=1033008 RepID=A0AAD7EV15_9AGAR|nr:hypothetical protein DFH08DRAFT_116110 [Mycena albidolilacea]